MGFLDNSGDIILDVVLTDHGRKELSKAHKTLRKTQYYDRLNKNYLRFLKVKPKKS